MRQIESLLPHVIPSETAITTELPVRQATLKPFAKIGLVPIESFAYKMVTKKNFLSIHFNF